MDVLDFFFVDLDHESDNGKIFACLYANITTFFLRLIAAKKKAGYGFNKNVYLNDAYCVGPGEQDIEMKCCDQAFSAGNVPDFGEHSYAAYNDLHPCSNHSGVVLKFPDSLAGKNSEDVAGPIYQTPDSGADTLIYQPINSGEDAPIYQPLNSNRKSSEV